MDDVLIVTSYVIGAADADTAKHTSNAPKRTLRVSMFVESPDIDCWGEVDYLVTLTVTALLQIRGAF